MTAPVARLGDVAGGVISSGLLTVKVGDQPIARLGDAISPHGTGIHGGTVIASGSGTVMAGDQRVARIGDVASCGHPISSGKLTVIAGP